MQVYFVNLKILFFRDIYHIFNDIFTPESLFFNDLEVFAKLFNFNFIDHTILDILK